MEQSNFTLAKKASTARRGPEIVVRQFDRASGNHAAEFGAASFRNPLVRAWCGPGAALELIKAAPK